MITSVIHRLAAGAITTALFVASASAQSTGQTTGTQTGTTGGTSTSGSRSSGTSNTGGPTITTNPLGMSLPTLNLGGTSSSSTSRSSTTGTFGRSSRSRTGTAGISGLGGANLGGGFSGGSSQAIQTNRQTRQRAQYVTQLAFDPAPAGQNVAQPQNGGPAEQSLAAIAATGARVEMQGSTAVLTGNVRTAEDRKLAELMTLLEPGVRSVRNELVVQADAVPAPGR